MIARIEEHFLRYPQMEAVDVLKLIYQSIFGGGHMITDAEKSRMRIEQEFDAEFKEWIINFPKKELSHVYSLLEKYKDKNVIIFKSHNEIDEFLEKL